MAGGSRHRRDGDVTATLAGLVAGGAIPPFVYCYPTRSAYRPLDPRWTVTRIWAEERDHSPGNDLNLYLHVPFCRYKCGFCNLYTVTSTDADLHDAYVDALCTELWRHAEIIRARNLRTVYIGGGTPSLLTTAHFERLFGTIDAIYPGWRPAVDEVCIEATPDSIVADPARMGDLVGLGVTRINMGVQSLEEAELRAAGRGLAGAEVVRRAVAIVKDHRLPNLSTDLIMGFEGQTDASWERSVRALIALDPETVSTYFLTVRPDAWFSRTGRYEYQRSPHLYARYELARSLLTEAGYVQETNVRYKRLGRGGYRQKVLQFRGVPVLGIGAGARTYTNTVDYLVGGSAAPRASQVWDHIAAVRAGGAPLTGGYVFDDRERLRKRFALDLFDLDLGELMRYGVAEHADIHTEVLGAAVELGLARTVGPTRYQLTPAGYQYRDILSWLFFSDEVVERDRAYYAGLHRANTRAVARLGEDVTVSGLTTIAGEPAAVAVALTSTTGRLPTGQLPTERLPTGQLPAGPGS